MTIDWKDAVARAVRRNRADLKISQEALAESAGISRNYVSRVESASADLSLVVFSRLAAAFGMRPWEFLRDAELALPIRKSPKVRKPISVSLRTNPSSPKPETANQKKDRSKKQSLLAR